MTVAPDARSSQQISLVDILDRVLATGAVITGELTLSIADVDLVYISLRALISSVRAAGTGTFPDPNTPSVSLSGAGESP